jgi:hypothetical protein
VRLERWWRLRRLWDEVEEDLKAFEKQRLSSPREWEWRCVVVVINMRL